MGKKLSQLARDYGLWIIPGLMVMLLYMANPFSHVILSRRFDLKDLTAIQRLNIQLAARALDGVILNPGEEFSFNRSVGPRTISRGYQPAPSYVGGESPDSVGGGICLLSSAVYQVALMSGLEIHQRVPHLRTIHSVPPGLDAAIWYGRSDLRFVNGGKRPVALYTQVNPSGLVVSLRGQADGITFPIRRLVSQLTPTQIQVVVFRRTSASEQLISRDIYRLSP